MKCIWKITMAKSEEYIYVYMYVYIYIYVCVCVIQWVAKNIEAWLKFYISSMIKYSHIWLNLPRSDTHFFYIFHLDDRHFRFIKSKKKKFLQKTMSPHARLTKKRQEVLRVWDLDHWHVTTLTKLYRESCLILFLFFFFFPPFLLNQNSCCHCCWWKLFSFKLLASSRAQKKFI
jgi:hypothetical protein